MAKKKAAKASKSSGVGFHAPEPHCMRAPAKRWQHGDREEHALDASRPKWVVQRARTAADLLLRRGDVTQEMHAAFERYRRDYELGMFGSSSPMEDRVSSSGNGMEGYLYLCVAAVSRVRAADQAVGPKGTALLLLFAVRCMSYSAAEKVLADQPDEVLGAPTEMTLKSALVKTMDILARHYSGDLYRVKAPRLEPQVSKAVEARPARREVKPIDLQAMRCAVLSRMDEYGRICASPDAVALLLKAEFGDWAEKVLEMEDA